MLVSLGTTSRWHTSLGRLFSGLMVTWPPKQCLLLASFFFFFLFLLDFLFINLRKSVQVRVRAQAGSEGHRQREKQPTEQGA